MAYTPEELTAHRAQWVAALRSGNYKQIKRQLRGKGDLQEDRYCCLGVLCEISGLVTWTEDVDGLSFLANTKESLEGRIGTLPNEVMSWVGLQSPIGGYGVHATKTSLSYNNDYGSDFLDIAAIIESEPDSLFR